MEFAFQNMIWIAAAIVSGGILLWPIFRRSTGKKITPQEAILLMNRENAILLDVRELVERKDGIVPNAQSAPLSALPERIKDMESKKKRNFIALCANGSRAIQACNMLHRHGFINLYILEGGLRAWREAGFPVKEGV